MSALDRLASPALKRGDEIRQSGYIAKVMVVSDGYVMARLKGCVPFIVPLKLAELRKVEHE
jgi:hypothetical protein